MGEVGHVFISEVRRRPMREVEEAEALAGQGLQRCQHGRPGSPRQVLLMDGETLGELRLEPGATKENITTRGLAIMDLPAGQRLRLGEALLEVTTPCEPCVQMDRIRDGLQAELRGRRGMLCRVVEAGRIRRGDRIKLAPEPGATVAHKG